MGIETARDEAARLDAEDELAGFREQFYLRPEQVYLDGNSLGPLSKAAEAAMLRVLDEWEMLGVEGWTEAETPWFTLAETLARQLAPLVGAEAEEVIVTNSTTVNLHQLLATLFQPEAARAKILTDALRFPSDAYALNSHLRLRGLDPAQNLVVVPSKDGMTLDEREIVAAMTEEVQMAVLPAVIYTSGQLLDMPMLTAEAHRRNILIGFDCAHSIGSVPHELSAWGVDFAFWCSYKHLNGGPGATGGLYLNRRHFGRAPGMAGWFSNRKETQFDMAQTLDPAVGAGALQIGTPNILSMAPLHGTLETIAEAGIERIRRKSLQLTEFLIRRIDSELSAHDFTLVTPREEARRGGHIALAHPEAVRICAALREAEVVPDFRPPNIVRLAPVALYTSFADCCEAVERLKTIMDERRYEEFPAERGIVT